MDFNRLKNISFLQDKSLVGVHLFGLSDNSFRGEVVELKKKKKQVTIIKQLVLNGSIEDICKQIPEKSAICLTIDGKGILFKQWDEEITNNRQIFRELGPQGDSNDFYLQAHPAEHTSHIAITRKDFIDPILKVFEKSGFVVLDLLFGAFILNQTKTFITETTETWNLPTRNIHWDNNLIEHFSTATTSHTWFIKFGDELVSSEHIISFSHAFWSLLSAENRLAEFEFIKENQDNHFYKRAIQYVGIGVLGFFFTLLIVNYLIFNNYSGKLNYTYASYENSLKVINKLEAYTEELHQKEELAKKVGVGKKDQLSYYADRLAGSIPSYITLTVLDINPLDSKRRKKDTPEFLKGEIIISGTLNNGVRLYQWIEKLKKFIWVENVEVIELSQNEPLKPAIFTLEVQYSNKIQEKK